MWPFRREEVPEPRTADGFALEDMRVCVECGRLVAKRRTKKVVCWYFGTTTTYRSCEEYYCPDCAPEYDEVHCGPFGTTEFRRIPEHLEEIVPEPAKVRRPRKGK